MPYFTTSFTTVAPNAGSTTANSTTPLTSLSANLNWIGGKPTTVSIFSLSSTSSGAISIQYTLDDILRTPSTSVIWKFTGSSAGSSTPAVYSASSWYDTGVTVAFLNPIAAVRMYSSGLDTGTITMKVIQGEGW